MKFPSCFRHESQPQWLAVISLRSIRCLRILLAVLMCSIFGEAQNVKLGPVSLAFGKQVINMKSAPKIITFTNTDTVSSLAIHSIVTSGNFSQTNNCGTSLAPGAKCIITVNFTPSVAGAITGEVTLEDNAANSPQLVNLTGAGVYPLSFTPAALNFGSVAVGNISAVKTVTLTNNRSSLISFNFRASGNFAVSGNGTTCATSLASNATCTIAMTFTPTTAVTIKGALTLIHNAAFSPQEVGLTGTGTGTVTAPLRFFPTTLSFVGVAVGTTSSVKTATISNTGRSAVSITSITASSVYAWSGSGSTPCKTGNLAAGATCTLAVTYRPRVAGTDTGSITVSYTGRTSPQMLNLTGNGLLPVTFIPTSLSFAAQAVGVTSTAKTVTLANNGTADLTIKSAVASGQYGVVAAGSTPCGSRVPVKGACTIGVTFTPASAATIKGVVTIAHDGLFSPQEIKLTGIGIANQISHVIVIFKENHSFDNYFGQFPGANGATAGQTSTGATIALAPMSDNPINCGHYWPTTKIDVNGGLMNGFDQTCSNLQAYVQASPSLIPNYWTYAKTYALADNMFAQQKGPSFPTHAYLFSESSNYAVGNPSNVPDQRQYGWGCDAAATGARVSSIDPTTGKSYSQPPCFTLATMGDALNAAGISWRIYSPQPGEGSYIWNFGSYYQNLWNGADRNKDVPVADFCSDAASGKLPHVAWLTPTDGYSEHPRESITKGESWTVQQVNCIMNSPYWSSSLIIVTWDDWGGFYDHVPPPAIDFFGYGIRVPLLAISPFAKPGYIGHRLYSFDSINKTIENIFGMPCLLTDCNVAVNDLSDLLTKTPTTPREILTPQSFVPQTQPLVIDGENERNDDDD